MTESQQSPLPRVVVLMGIAGAGKSTVGRKLAAALHWRFIEADDYHSDENKSRMCRGLALTDREREPWLTALRDEIGKVIASGGRAVLACSALKAAYREALVPATAPDGAVKFVYLHADPALLQARLERRTRHYAGPTLLASQLATLEEPHDALEVDASRPPGEIVITIRSFFRL